MATSVVDFPLELLPYNFKMQTQLDHVESPITVTLTMSKREARVLRTVCFRTAGSAAGPRGVMTAIGDLLSKHGITPYAYRVLGSIQFPDTFTLLEDE